MTGRALAAATSVTFTVNRASVTEICAHLARCDAHFIPPLSTRVDLRAYAEKIVNHAERFEAWSTSGLAGLVAAYANDAGRAAVFVTSVSVVPELWGRGVGRRLMENCIDHARRMGFERLSLRVDREQAAAIGLYERCGFSRVPPPSPALQRDAVPGQGSDIIMTLEFNEDDGHHARL